MKNIEYWKLLIKELFDSDIYYQDTKSVFIEYENGYVVIEKDENNRLQLQFRKSTDHQDIVVSENIVTENKTVSELTHTNFDGVKKCVMDFAQKL